MLDCFRFFVFSAESPRVCAPLAMPTRLAPAFLTCPNVTHDNSRREEFLALGVAAVHRAWRGELEYHLFVLCDEFGRQA
jgi:hypothetical protein